MRKYLKTLRKNIDVTQAEIAVKTNISCSYYCEIENGNRQQNITLDLLEKLALAFDVPISEMIECENKYKAVS